MASDDERWRARVARQLVLLVLPLVTASPSAAVAAQSVCRGEQQVGLSFAFTTNRTGHSQLNVSVEQPVNRSTWLIGIELSTTSCGTSGNPRLVLEVSLGGAPLGTLQNISLGSPLKKPAPPGYTLLPGLGYYRRPEIAMKWEDARQLCTSEGATLLLPNTVHEIESIVALFPTNVSGTNENEFVWVGASDLAQEGKWITVKGQPLDEATTVSRPTKLLSDGDDQNCLLYYSGYFNDFFCHFLLAFYCKWESS